MADSKSSNSLFGGGGCLTLFGLPFLAAGFFMSLLYFFGYSQWWAAQTWAEVPCWIESTNLEISHSKDSTSYKTEATYRYEYAGNSYQGNRVSFGAGFDNIGSFQQNAHHELSNYVREETSAAERDPQRDTRKPFRCYVNPQNPSESVIYRTLRWPMQAFMAIFALTFPAVGAGLVAGGFIGAWITRKEAKLRGLHPDEPWKWKTKWTGRGIPDSSTAGVPVLASYTLWSALVISPLILTTAMSGAFQTDPMAWLLLIFVAIWCVPAWFTLKRLRHRLAIGKTRFELREVPAWPGGLLQGSILLAKPLPSRGIAELSLGCEKRTTHRSGKNTTTFSEKIWMHRENVPQERITRDFAGLGFRLPVSFTIPPDAPESGTGADTSVEHTWNLEFKVPDTAIHSMFEVPVFRTEKSPIPMPGAAVPSISEMASSDLPTLLAEQRIKANFDPAGTPLSIICPPARHRSLIIFLAFFNLIWTTAAVVMVQQNAPLIFQIIWPLSAGAIWLSIFWQILYKRTVTFTRDGIRLRHQLGPVNRERMIQKSEIVGFSHDTNMTSNNVNFYRVRLEDVFGRKKTIASGINHSATAEALVRCLEAWKKSA